MKKIIHLITIISIINFSQCGIHLKYAKIQPEGRIKVQQGPTILSNISIPVSVYKLRPMLRINLNRDLLRSFHKAGVQLQLAHIPKGKTELRKEDVWDSRKWFFKPGSYHHIKKEYAIDIKNAKTAVFVYLVEFKKGHDIANDWIIMDIDFVDTESLRIVSSYRLTGFYDAIISELSVIIDANK